MTLNLDLSTVQVIVMYNRTTKFEDNISTRSSVTANFMHILCEATVTVVLLYFEF